MLEPLRARKPDAVAVGFGLRGFPEMTHFIEQLVNAVHEELPEVKRSSHTSPDSTLDAVRRWFPAEK